MLVTYHRKTYHVTKYVINPPSFTDCLEWRKQWKMG